MSREKNVLMVTTGILIGILIAGTAAHTAEAPSIRVSNYRGTALGAGERSGLVISPSGTAYTMTSSDPDTVAVEQMMNCWVAVIKAEGNVEITASNQAGEAGTLALTMGPDAPRAPTAGGSPGQGEASDTRLELVRLVNETHWGNGVTELTVNEALMNAAQSVSGKEYSWHHTKGGYEAVLTCGYPYRFGMNLTVLTGAATKDAVQRALKNWISSSDHFETMIDPDGDSIGVGVTERSDMAYCYLFVDYPNTHNPYE